MVSLPESGRTEVSPAAARAFVAAAIAVLAFVPVAQHAVPPTAGPFAPFAADFAALFRAGDGALFFAVSRRLERRMHDLERGLEDQSWILERALPAVQWALAGWGGAGNEKVYVGHRGWLFYRPGYDYVAGAPFLDRRVLERRRDSAPSWEEPPRPDPRPAVLDLRRQLAELGIRLVVMPAPTKAMVHPDALAPSYAGRGVDAAALHNPSFGELRSVLEAHGVVVFDPAATLARLRPAADAFLLTDSHWSPAGVDAVARELAARVRALELPFAGPETAYERRAQEHEGVGDLARALRLPDWGRLYPPETVRFVRIFDPGGRPWANDAAAEVLLVGDSFANVYSDPGLGWGRSAGLAEQLSYHLRRGVYRVAVNNAGATGSRRRLAEELRAGRTRLAGKKVVIWEVAVRELAAGDWRPVPLPGVP